MQLAQFPVQTKKFLLFQIILFSYPCNCHYLDKTQKDKIPDTEIRRKIESYSHKICILFQYHKSCRDSHMLNQWMLCKVLQKTIFTLTIERSVSIGPRRTGIIAQILVHICSSLTSRTIGRVCTILTKTWTALRKFIK